MEKLIAIGPYTAQMKASLKRYLPDDMEIEYITGYESYDRLKQADYLILRTLRLEEKDILPLQHTKLIQRWGAGYDTVDLKAAGKKGIPVAVAAGVNAQSVAEMAVLMMLALSRNLILQVKAFHAGEDRRVELAQTSRCLSGRTVGILGMGNIGRRVARILNGFGASLLYYDPRPLDPEQEKALGCRRVDVDEIFAQSDILTLHLPLMEQTRSFVNAQRLAAMKPEAIFINTARAQLVVEEDLAQALRLKKLAGAGLDELCTSPEQSPLIGLDNVICTPHIGGSTLDINDEMARVCIEHILTVRRGEKLVPPALVNGEELK